MDRTCRGGGAAAALCRALQAVRMEPRHAATATTSRAGQHCGASQRYLESNTSPLSRAEVEAAAREGGSTPPSGLMALSIMPAARKGCKFAYTGFDMPTRARSWRHAESSSHWPFSQVSLVRRTSRKLLLSRSRGEYHLLVPLGRANGNAPLRGTASYLQRRETKMQSTNIYA